MSKLNQHQLLFITKEKENITKKDYNQFLVDAFQDKSITNDDRLQIFSFLYEDCNINFLQYLKYNTNITEIIIFLDVESLNIPKNCNYDRIAIASSVKNLVININTLNPKKLTIRPISANSALENIYLMSDSPCSVQLDLHNSIADNIKLLYVNENIEQLRLYKSDVLASSTSATIEVGKRNTPFKINKALQDTGKVKYLDYSVKPLEESLLSEAYSSSMPDWLTPLKTKDNAKYFFNSYGIRFSDAQFITVNPKDLKLKNSKDFTNNHTCFYLLGYPINNPTNYVIYQQPKSSDDKNEYYYFYNNRWSSIPYKLDQYIIKEYGKSYSKQLPQKIAKDLAVAFCYVKTDNQSVQDRKKSRIDRRNMFKQGFSNKKQDESMYETIMSDQSIILDKSGYIKRNIDDRLAEIIYKYYESDEIEKALNMIKRQVDKVYADYKDFSDSILSFYSSTLVNKVTNLATELQDVLRAYENLTQQLIIPALYNYSDEAYLKYIKNQQTNYYKRLRSSIKSFYARLERDI